MSPAAPDGPGTVGRTACGLAGAALLVGAAAISSSALAAWLDPGAEAARRSALEAGAVLFRAGAAAHGLLLLLVAGRGLPRRGAALWQSPAAARAEPPLRGEVALFLGLLALAAVLRGIGLGSDLWLDEVFTLTDFVRVPALRIVSDFPSDNQHLLYSLLAHACVVTLGESAVSLRLPAVGFGLASLWALWRLGRQLVGPREGLLAVALLAVSYHHVWFSQNARGYTGLLFATLLATHLLLRGLAGGRAGVWLAYAATVATGMAIHLTMIFVAAAHGLVVVALLVRARVSGAPRTTAWHALAALALAGLFTLQVYALVIPQMLAFFARPAGGSGTAAVEWKNPLWMLNETLRGLGLGLALGWAGLLGAAALFGSGCVSLARRAPAASALFLLPPLLGGATMIALGRNLWPRFFFDAFGFAALFAVHGAAVLGSLLPRIAPGPARRLPRAVGLGLAALLVLASAIALPRAWRLPKQDFSGARDFVLAERGPRDRVVAVGLAAEAYHRYYAPDWAVAQTSAELEALRSPDAATWVLYTLPGYLTATAPDLMALLQREFEPVRSFPGTLGDGTVFVRRSIGRYAPGGRPEAAARRGGSP